jgi:hypothetical protein
MPGKRVKPDYVTKPQLDEALAAQDQRFDAKLAALGNAMLDKFEQLSAELAGHAKAIQESVAGQIKVVDEKYADLPARVAALEARSTP